MSSRAIQRVLVTGSHGYIGSVCCPQLAAGGFDVLGLDARWYDNQLLLPRPDMPPVLHMDIRDVQPDDLLDVDAIVHLAALSNDPLGEIDPHLTHAINHHATVRLAEMARKCGVGRFIYASSCSVYGAAGDKPLGESAPLAPQTAYAHSKINAERDLLDMSDDTFAVVSLRNATAFGISPSQRFDIVLPNLAGSAWVHGELRLLSDGTPWRPLVHIRDITRAIQCSLTADVHAIAGRVFNVGAMNANHQVRDIARAVHERHPDHPPIRIAENSNPDTRTYLVDFQMIHRDLKGYHASWSLADGADECMRVFDNIQLDEATFTAPAFTRLHRLQELMTNGQLDTDLRWTSNMHAAPVSAMA